MVFSWAPSAQKVFYVSASCADEQDECIRNFQSGKWVWKSFGIMLRACLKFYKRLNR